MINDYALKLLPILCQLYKGTAACDLLNNNQLSKNISNTPLTGLLEFNNSTNWQTLIKVKQKIAVVFLASCYHYFIGWLFLL